MLSFSSNLGDTLEDVLQVSSASFKSIWIATDFAMVSSKCFDRIKAIDTYT